MSPNARQVMLLSVLYFTGIFLLLALGGCALRKVEAGDFRVWTAEKKRCANNPRGVGEGHRNATIPCFFETALCKFGSERQMGKKVFRKIVAVRPRLELGQESPVRQVVQLRNF